MAARGASPGLDLFIAALAPGARVLDLGCGPGLDAEHVARSGHDVLAVDASASMVALAGERAGVTARLASFDAIRTLGRFGGIWASFSLLHAPRVAFRRHLADLRTACAPGAVLGLGMKLGQGEGTDRLGRFYTYYDESDLRDLLEAAGFIPRRMLRGRGKGLAGTEDAWIFLLAHV